ncbi:MAG: fasciclin domain-containing protein [Sediminispirochaetaceae bacterium]
MKKIVIGILVLSVFILASCAGTPESKEDGMKAPMAEEMPSIAEIAVDDGRFTTLVAALDAADLVDTLSNDGPLTVFAPTDDAFAKLPEGTVESLLNDIPTLKSILLYHVVSGKVMASDVVEIDSAPTLNGKDVMVKVDMGKVYINDAQVIITDIEASNGVIHVIDTVILP